MSGRTRPDLGSIGEGRKVIEAMIRQGLVNRKVLNDIRVRDCTEKVTTAPAQVLTFRYFPFLGSPQAVIMAFVFRHGQWRIDNEGGGSLAKGSQKQNFRCRKAFRRRVEKCLEERAETKPSKQIDQSCNNSSMLDMLTDMYLTVSLT